MSILGLLITIVMLLGLLLYLAYPFMTASARQQATLDRQRERALAYYERVLTNIRDLDEDHITGKIEATEYSDEREVWMQRGIKLLKLLDDLETKQPIVMSDDDAAIDSAIEDAIASYKQHNTQEAS